MARDGNGGYNLPELPFVFDTVIQETAVNNNFSDLGNEIANSIAKDGQTDPTANLPMATFKHTGVGNANARDQYAAAGQVTDGALLYGGVAGGTANALTITLSPAVTALVTGARFLFKASASANTGAATLAVNGLTAVALQKNDAALSAGDIEANKWYEGLYDGTAVQLTRLSTLDGYSDPLTTQGDIVYRNGSTTDRLAIGSNNTVLRSTGTAPTWGSIGTNDIANSQITTPKIADNAVTGAKIAMGSDAAGDIIYYDGTNFVRLPKGIDGQALKLSGGLPVWQTLSGITPDFTSAEQTITVDSQLDVAHSLGGIPSLFQVILRCKTANLGYGVGDEILLPNVSEAADIGATAFADSTNVSIVTSASIQVISASTFNSGSITTTSWRYIIRAWS